MRSFVISDIIKCNLTLRMMFCRFCWSSLRLNASAKRRGNYGSLCARLNRGSPVLRGTRRSDSFSHNHVATESTGDPVTTYNVLRGTTSGGESSTPLAAVAASTCTTVCTYVDTTVVGGSTYFYEISATNSGGTSAPGGETSTTIPFFVPAIPAKPTVVGK